MDIFVGNTNLIELTGLSDPLTDTPIIDATVTVTIKDREGEDVEGQTWPLSLAYVPDSDGDYRATIGPQVDLAAGDLYVIEIVAVATQGTLAFTDRIRARTRSSCIG